MPRYGRVFFEISYVVDLDNRDMVDDAKQCVFEDVMSAVTNDEVAECIKIKPDATASEADIPEFLLGRQDEDEDDDWINDTKNAPHTPET